MCIVVETEAIHKSTTSDQKRIAVGHCECEFALRIGSELVFQTKEKTRLEGHGLQGFDFVNGASRIARCRMPDFFCVYLLVRFAVQSKPKTMNP